MHELKELKDGSLCALSYDIRMNRFNMIERVVIHTIVSRDEDEIFDYLTSMGVDENDLEYVLDLFEEQGHNLANFGVHGSLITTGFSGTLQ